MKKMFQRKTATLLAVIMSLSLLIPVIAYAANGAKFSSGPTFNSVTGNVTGQVYITDDVYDALKLAGDDVEIQVYNGADVVGIVYGTYLEGATDGYYYYNYSVPSASYSNYSWLYFKYFYNGSQLAVSDVVYRSTPSGGGGGGFFGGGGTNADGSVSADANGNVNASALAAALADGTATIKITGDVANLPASALTETGTIEIVTDEGVSYILPLSALDVDAIAASLGVVVGNLTISVQIKALNATEAAGVNAAAQAAGGSVLSAVVDFKISAVGGGKTLELNNFPSYIARKLPLNKAITNPTTVTGVVYTPGQGVSFVPTTVATENGKSVATLKRNSNSIYTVIEVSTKSFADLKGHWAKADVENLAGKLVITGTSATTFEPKRNITRAEVAALIVRSLGLNSSVTNSTYKFSDVSSTKWYSGVVSAAAAAGIINGYTDGTFKPDAAITRRDLAAMIVRAQAFAGKKITLTDAQVTQALSGYTDVATLGGQKNNVAIAVHSGLMKGQTGKLLAGLANTNRAEAATLIARLLQDVDFID